jgi:ribosomal protein S6
MTENTTISTKEGFKVYELGIHLLPTLSEADVQVEFSKIKSQIEKLEGEFISESTPRLMTLAYEIPKTIKAQKRWYETAYFGWVKFELEAKELAVFEKFVKELEHTLRYLIVKTVREDTIVSEDLLANDIVTEDVIAPKAEVSADVVTETLVETENL